MTPTYFRRQDRDMNLLLVIILVVCCLITLYGYQIRNQYVATAEGLCNGIPIENTELILACSNYAVTRDSVEEGQNRSSGARRREAARVVELARHVVRVNAEQQRGR